MKRHLVFPLTFDSRAILLDDINPDWEESVKVMHAENQARIIAELKEELGENNFDLKMKNFKDLGPAPFSIISYHIELFKQSRYAFIHGFYYSALTATCALGERIFNHIILDLRESFKDRESYRKIFRKNSFCDWDAAIEIMSEWDIFFHDDVEKEFKTLAEIRHRSIHFNPSTYQSIRDEALLALNTLSKIISLQFGFADEGNKWLIDGIEGYFFIKKEAENFPFIKRYYLPQCPLVGYKFAMDISSEGQWLFFDFQDYDIPPVSDFQFAQLIKNRSLNDMAPTKAPLPKGIIIQQIVTR